MVVDCLHIVLHQSTLAEKMIQIITLIGYYASDHPPLNILECVELNSKEIPLNLA